MSRFAKVNLLEVEDSVGGRVEGLEGRFGEASGLPRPRGQSLSVRPNLRSPMAQSHKEQEEAYVVVAGSGRILLDDETQELRSWDVIRVAPEVVRAFEAGPDGLEIIAVGGPKPEEGDGVRAGELARQRIVLGDVVLVTVSLYVRRAALIRPSVRSGGAARPRLVPRRRGWHRSPPRGRSECAARENRSSARPSGSGSGSGSRRGSKCRRSRSPLAALGPLRPESRPSWGWLQPSDIRWVFSLEASAGSHFRRS